FCTIYLPDLHSFPTRRSSDLLCILRPFSQDSPGSVSTGETPRQKMSKVVAPRDTKLDSARELTKSNPTLTRSSKPKKPQNVLHQDRKSTRLNSSHVAISYAVF